MYFAARQYPELRKLARIQRLRLLAKAIRSENKWIGRRLMLAFFIGVVGSGSVAWLPESLGVPDWGGTGVGVMGGSLFYAYLLWELNGPLLLAVKTHVAAELRANNDA